MAYAEYQQIQFDGWNGKLSVLGTHHVIYNVVYILVSTKQGPNKGSCVVVTIWIRQHQYSLTSCDKVELCKWYWVCRKMPQIYYLFWLGYIEANKNKYTTAQWHVNVSVASFCGSLTHFHVKIHLNIQVFGNGLLYGWQDKMHVINKTGLKMLVCWHVWTSGYEVCSMSS